MCGSSVRLRSRHRSSRWTQGSLQSLEARLQSLLNDMGLLA